MAVAALKKIVEGDSNYDESCVPSEILLEIFCVDTSISMSRSQHFPYIFGESKLQMCKKVIDRGFTLPAHAILHTALVKFNATATLAVPFGPHTPEHSAQIKAELDTTEHQKGSIIYSAYAFCEKAVSDYQAELDIQGAKVLIHLFTDGMDNGSVAEDVAKYQGSVALDPANTGNSSAKGEESLRQSFLYSLDTAFAESSVLAKSLQAHLVVINESDITAALEERDKWVLKFLAQRKVAKARAGFNLAKGYTPDLASVYKVLQKVYRYFSGSGLAFLSQEGLFRINANVNESKRLANQLLTNSEFLNDFEDSILVAHSLKTALSTSPPILPPSFQHILVEVSKHVKSGRFRKPSVSASEASSSAPAPAESGFGDALNRNEGEDSHLTDQNFVLELAKTKIFELPHLNLQCLHILLYLLNLVASQEATNKMGAANLSTIFTFLLFPELLVPNPGLQELIAILVARVNDVFPHPPQLKMQGNGVGGRSMSEGKNVEMQVYATQNLPVIMPVAAPSGVPTIPQVLPAPPSLSTAENDAKPRVIKKSVSLTATTHEMLANPVPATSASVSHSTETSPTKTEIHAGKSPLSSPRSFDPSATMDASPNDASKPVNPLPRSNSSTLTSITAVHPVPGNSNNPEGANASSTTSPTTTLKRQPSVRPSRDPPPVPVTGTATLSRQNSLAPLNPPPPVPTSPRIDTPAPEEEAPPQDS